MDNMKEIGETARWACIENSADWLFQTVLLNFIISWTLNYILKRSNYDHSSDDCLEKKFKDRAEL